MAMDGGTHRPSTCSPASSARSFDFGSQKASANSFVSSVI
jgi:hypothetical protein